MSAISSTAATFTNEMQQLTFGWTDYLLFTGLLGISLFIGIYFGFFSKQDSAKEYLFGGKTMSYFPVALSILASLLSGITFLGIPTEIYFHGTQYVVVLIPAILTCIVTAEVFMPLFYELRISSSYEYLELRFSKRIRTLASILYIISIMTYIPIVIYVPALAFSQVTGYNIHTITPIFSLVCITYTTLGGVKAVVWTDTIQFFFTVGGLIMVLIIGIQAVDGFSEIWRIAKEGNRLEIFDMDPSPFKRTSFWGMTIGMFFMSLSRFATGQKFIQRFLSIERKADIKKAVYVQLAGWMLLQGCCVFTGLLVYAKYYNCDPLSAKLVKRSDQTLPFYVMDIAGHIHGLPGIFLAGLVSSALSTMSASLNTLSGMIYDVFVDPWISEGPKKESKAANIMKLISFLIGLVTVGLIFVIEHLGTIFEMANSLGSIVDGPLFGIFMLGMFVPWVGKRGAITGGSIALVFMMWVVGGTQWHILNKHIRATNLVTTTKGCPYPLNETLSLTNTTEATITPHDEPWKIFQISFLYLILLGTIVCMLIALITSLIIEENDLSTIDPLLIVPIFRRFLPKKVYQEVPLKEITKEKIKN